LAEVGGRRRRAVKELVPDRLWIREMPLRLFGVELGTRMSVVRLSGEGDGLWLHSPVALDRPLREELDELGRVRFVVCPNRGHHMFAGEYFAAYPDASFYAAPGLLEKGPISRSTGCSGTSRSRDGPRTSSRRSSGENGCCGR
jgi:Domain of unknown function (DUF4336)